MFSYCDAQIIMSVLHLSQVTENVLLLTNTF